MSLAAAGPRRHPRGQDDAFGRCDRPEDIEAVSGSTAAAYRAIDRLASARFIEEITGRKKDRVWAASEVMAELDDLDRRIQSAMHEGNRR